MYSMGYDPEAIYQDADIEMAEIQEAVRELDEEARTRGITVAELLEQREAEIEAEIEAEDEKYRRR
jgi:DNA-binding transcriptional MerR regulator